MGLESLGLRSVHECRGPQSCCVRKHSRLHPTPPYPPQQHITPTVLSSILLNFILFTASAVAASWSRSCIHAQHGGKWVH